MITIKGTTKIKGALDLSGINRQLKAGDRLPLTDEDFSDHTVQMAVSMGFITYEQGGILDVSSKSGLIKLRNIYDRPIRINALEDEVRAGQTFTLSEDQVNNGDIRGALAKGLLEIVSSARAAQEMDESNVRIGNIFSEDETQEIPIPEGDNLRYLETNEELPAPKVIETDDPKPIEKANIPDPKGKTVIWNPTNDPVIHTKTHQMDAVSIGKDGETEMIESDVDVSDISFVDAELDQKRKDSHPVLKDTPNTKDDGIDFL